MLLNCRSPPTGVCFGMSDEEVQSWQEPRIIQPTSLAQVPTRHAGNVQVAGQPRMPLCCRVLMIQRAGVAVVWGERDRRHGSRHHQEAVAVKEETITKAAPSICCSMCMFDMPNHVPTAENWVRADLHEHLPTASAMRQCRVGHWRCRFPHLRSPARKKLPTFAT